MKKIRPKISECSTTRARTPTLARVRAVHEHEKYIAHATCADLYYVHSKFEAKPYIDKRMLNHARARTRALARVPAVHLHDTYVPM
jgi:hypothetical protein